MVSSHPFGRVNLIVGMNNCGKTSVLESVQMLKLPGDLTSVWSILSRRGEDLFDDREGLKNPGRLVDVRRLFHLHEIPIGASFEIRSRTDAGSSTLIAQITDSKSSQGSQGFQGSQGSLFEGEASEDDLLQPSALVFRWYRGKEEMSFVINTTRKGGISLDSMRRQSPTGTLDNPNTRFITAAALSAESIVDLFESIVLTPEEDLVIEALNIIEPTIERIATSGTDRWRSSVARPWTRGGLLVRCRDIKSRIPIGSMGDGIWRMLGLALALVQSQNGVLLVDEIDTGLHFTVMADMWKLVYKTARRLNVQVFATTHSRDCYESLAVLCRNQQLEHSDITLQRVERGRSEAVMYTEQEITAAANRGMEVR